MDNLHKVFKKLLRSSTFIPAELWMREPCLITEEALDRIFRNKFTRTRYIQKINKKRTFIAEELYDWAETFNFTGMNDEEEDTKDYDSVYSLADRLENDACSLDDYKNILFHIEQINYNKVIIRL